MRANSGQRSSQCPAISTRHTEHYPLPTTHYPLPRSGFTLTELLVTITIIGILASLVLGAMHASRETAHEYATKATIVKLNNIILERYESYMTRRVPIDTSGLSPEEAAVDRLYAIRDLMRMEMPDRQYDVMDYNKIIISPITLPYSLAQVPSSAVFPLYYNRLANASPGNGSALSDVSAELLYMIVSIGTPENMEQFNQSEIGDVDGNGLPEFLDGWGRPISFLRWAPSLVGSDIQANTTNDQHDPFDSRHTELAYQLVPLVYSAGADGKPGLQRHGFTSSSDPGFYFANPAHDYGSNRLFTNVYPDFIDIGAPSNADGSDTDYFDNITNHHIEQR